MTNPEKDPVLEGAENTVNFINYMLQERAQLYGTIIYLMQVLEKDEIGMPPIESMQEYEKTFYAAFTEEEGGQFFLSIHPRDGEEEDGTED